MNKGIVERVFDKIVATLNMAGSIYIFILMLVIVRDVLGRVLLGNALVGTPEIVANSLVAILFLQTTYVLRQGRHVRATILVDILPHKVRSVLDIITSLLGIVLFVFIIYSGWDLFVKAVEIGEYEGEGGFHFYTAPVRFMVLFGSALMSIQFLFIIRQQIKELIKHEENITMEGGNA